MLQNYYKKSEVLHIEFILDIHAAEGCNIIKYENKVYAQQILDKTELQTILFDFRFSVAILKQTTYLFWRLVGEFFFLHSVYLLINQKSFQTCNKKLEVGRVNFYWLWLLGQFGLKILQKILGSGFAKMNMYTYCIQLLFYRFAKIFFFHKVYLERINYLLTNQVMIEMWNNSRKKKFCLKK